MKHLLGSAAVAALLFAGVPAWAQTSTDHNAPGAAGVSKPGVPGQPGNKSGPSAREPSGSSGMSGSSSHQSGTTSGPASGDSGTVSNSGAQMQDQAKVPGMPGNKSGPSAKEPGQSEKK
jgi:hypothetical protein